MEKFLRHTNVVHNEMICNFLSSQDIAVDSHRALAGHGDCARATSLVRVWVILDRPPNDPFLRKKEPFTSSIFHNVGRKLVGGRFPTYCECGNRKGMRGGNEILTSLTIPPHKAGLSGGGRV